MARKAACKTIQMLAGMEYQADATDITPKDVGCDRGNVYRADGQYDIKLNGPG